MGGDNVQNRWIKVLNWPIEASFSLDKACNRPYEASLSPNEVFFSPDEA